MRLRLALLFVGLLGIPLQAACDDDDTPGEQSSGGVDARSH